MSREPSDPREPADEQRTTALPRRPGGSPAGPPRPDSEVPAYQETTVLRRPPPPAVSNVPGATRAPRERRSLPPYDGPRLPPYDDDRGQDDRAHDGGRVTGDNRYRDRPGYGDQPTPGGSAPGGSRLGDDGVAAGQRRPHSATDGDGDHPATGPTGGSGVPRGLRRPPRKLTVTRVAALRSRELTHRGIEKFHGAVSADGAGRSGLSQLTYAVMGNYAVDAALAVALANTLFFAAAKAESTGKVLLYLLLTVAPFAIIAPLIGPALDKLQRGRRFALAASSIGRAALAVVMALNFDSWIIYPCALGMLVLSKGFGVLKAALTPRVLPEAITLVKTNSRLTVFGLIAGGAAGSIAAGIAALTTSTGALWFTALCGIVGAWLCLRIPAWVESTAGEVPIHHTGVIDRPRPGGAGTTADPGAARATSAAEGTSAPSVSARAPRAAAPKRRAMPGIIVQTLWANATIRIETGFLALFIAFVIKTRYQTVPATPTPGVALGAGSDDQGWMQLLLLGAIGAAAGVGGFLGNALGAKLPLRSPETVAMWCLSSVILSVVLAFAVPGLVTAGVVALVGSTASSLAKVCLDATIQSHLPEASRASAFGRSESVLQLSWVFGGVIGLLIGGIWALGGNAVYLVGFGIVGLLLLAGATQCVALRLGKTLLPPRGALLRSVRGRRGAGSAACGQQPRSQTQPPARRPRRAGKPR